MFNEEWELLTEPLLLNSLNCLQLSGIACEGDSLAEKREEFWKNFSQDYPSESKPSVSELEGHVRDKIVQKIELTDHAAVRTKFEEKNKHLNLYYTKDIFETFLDIF